MNLVYQKNKVYQEKQCLSENNVYQLDKLSLSVEKHSFT